MIRGFLIAVLVALAAAPAGQAAPPSTGDFKTPFTTSLITDNVATPNRSIGTLHVRYENGDAGDEVCSAAVVDAPNRSTLITAGHCVWGGSVKGLAIAAFFAPGGHDGAAPLGVWDSARIVPSGPWMLSGHSHFDWAFLVLEPNNRGRYVEDAVGGLPIAFNQPRDQVYRSLGYPQFPSPPYDGNKLWACDSKYGGDTYDPDPDEQYGPPIMYIGCDFGKGASGGPWLNASGVVSSVNSTKISNRPNLMGGPYLGDDAAASFASVSTIVPATRCKKKRRGKRHAAAAKKKKKKCKKRKKR